MLLCLLSNSSHCLQCLQWILTHRRLSRKHNCICTIINCIRYIGNLSSCRSRISNHRIKHLCCCNNWLTSKIALLNQHLLNSWNLLCWNLNTHITSSYHDTISKFKNLIDIVDTFLVLDLSNNLHIGILLCDDLSDLTDCCSISYEWCGNKLKSKVCTKAKIFFILICKRWKLNWYTRYIDSLSLSEFAAI